jgi:N-acylneuraminate cytidylyltransferase/CMP-N,N'-diacetyllegionaminic acid synthase
MPPSPTVLATICARGGSKGVPGKNLRPLLGRPMIAYAIEGARACPAIDAIVISTDDDRIAHAAEDCGLEVPFRRPAELASDLAPKLPVIRHAAQWMEENRGLRPTFVLDLDVTVPLRAPEDIAACVAALTSGGWDAVVTVYEPDRNPYFNMVEVAEGLARPVKTPPRPLTRRQDAPPVWSISGSVFGFRREFLDRGDYIYDGRVGVVEIPRARAIDVDAEVDLAFVEFLMRRSRGVAEP